MIMKISKVLCLALLLSGCATHIVKTGNPNTFYPATSPANVQVYYKTKPKCQYVEIALIDNPVDSGIFSKWKSTLQESVDQVKEEAAKLGADFIVINKYRKSVFANDKLVDSASAYKCIAPAGK